MNRLKFCCLLSMLALCLSACTIMNAGENGSSPGNGVAVNNGNSNGSNSNSNSNSSNSNSNSKSSGTLTSKSSTSNSPGASSTPDTVKSEPELLFAEGTELYEKGDYKAAIRKLQAAKDAASDASAIQQNSLKYLAFSYCVTGQKALCKVQFVSLLKMTPEFQLSRAEAGHPLWGPVFKEAKAGGKAQMTTTASTGK
jgi:hypothetical protein